MMRVSLYASLDRHGYMVCWPWQTGEAEGRVAWVRLGWVGGCGRLSEGSTSSQHPKDHVRAHQINRDNNIVSKMSRPMCKSMVAAQILHIFWLDWHMDGDWEMQNLKPIFNYLASVVPNLRRKKSMDIMWPLAADKAEVWLFLQFPAWRNFPTRNYSWVTRVYSALIQ